MSVVTRIRAWPRNVATGLAVAVYLAGGSNGLPHHDGANHYMAGVIAHPRFEASLSFDDDGWSARAVPAVSAVGWQPGAPARLDPLASLYWRDAAIEIERIAGGVVTRRLTGTVAEATIKDGALVITCADLTNRLDKAIAPATFGGTGDIEGDEVATGRAKRRSYGRVWNVEGRLLSTAHQIYEFGDPSRPLQGCSAMRDMGRAGPLGILAWQGSIDATLAALKASSPERGGGVFAPSIACAKWWTQPSGPLTADLLGEADGYSDNVVGIAAQLLASANGPAIANASAAALLRTGAAGLHIGDTSETTATALNRLLQNVTLIWMLTPGGDIEVRPWTFAAPVETLHATFISRESTLKPIASRSVGYRKNERVHGDGEISAAILAEDVTYEDGTSLEDLKPAELGATKGAPDDTHVGDVVAADVIAALKQLAATPDPAAIVAGATNTIDALKALVMTPDPAEMIAGAHMLVNALKVLVSQDDPDAIVAGAQSVVDRIRTGQIAGLKAQLLAQDRKDRFDRLLHLDGVPLGTRVVQEINQRIEGDTAIAERLFVLEATAVGDLAELMARIVAEEIVRASADAAETLQREVAISAVQTAMDGHVVALEASISSEATTRADAISAETSARNAQVSLLQGQVEGGFADVQAALLLEATTRATADEAETYQRELALAALETSINGQITTVQASIESEAETRATADAAETVARAAAISSLQTTVNGQIATVTAAIGSEATTRATADAAETAARALAISSLQTTINGQIATVEASIASEATTRATADAAETTARNLALSALQTSIDGQITDVEAALASEATTRATADEAEVTARTAAVATLTSGLASANAAITSEATARATADTAEATTRAAQVAALSDDIIDVSATISAEATTRAAADLAETNAREAAISSLQTAVDGQVATVTAAIGSEATTRATADAAETAARELAISSLVTSIDGQITDVEAALASEATTRATADAAEVTAREAAVATLTSGLASANAAITSEASARATADTAEATTRAAQVAALSDDISDVSAAISTEATTRATADGAETVAREAAISSLQTVVDGQIATVTAAIGSEATTRATADAAETAARNIAISTLQTSIDGQIADVEAALGSEATTRATADAAEVTARTAAIASVESDIADANAAITTEATARAAADSAEATTRAAQVASLTTGLGTANAAITSEATTRAAADSALSSAISAVSTTVGGHTATLTTHASSIDGLLLKWGLVLNSNGHIVGIGLNNDGDTGGVDIVADYLRIWNADGTVSAPVFSFSGSTIEMLDVRVRTIIAGSGNTAQFAYAAASSTVTGTGISNDHVVLTKTVTLLQRGAIDATAAVAASYGGSVSNSKILLKIDGEVVFPVGGGTQELSFVLAGAMPDLDPGDYTVEVVFAAPSTMSVVSRTLSTTIIYAG